MIDHTHESPDPIVDRAAAAMQSLDVPEAPSGEELSQLVQAVVQQSQRVQAAPTGWTRMTRRAGVLLAASVLVAAMAVGWSMLGHQHVLFADVVQRIRESKTIFFKSTVETEGMPPVVMTQTLASPGYVRIRGDSDDGPITIFDKQESAGLMLNPKTKQAIKLTSAQGLPKEAASLADFIDWLKTPREHSKQDLGPRKIEGKPTFGFRVRKDNQDYDVWVDQETGLPLRIESTFEVLGKTVSFVMDEFVFDAKVDPELFSLTPPEGYTVAGELAMSEPSERHLTDLLRFLADHLEGKFPDGLDIPTLLKLKLVDKENKPFDKDELLQTTRKITNGLMFVKMHEVHYTGRGVKHGDAGKIVCWWKPKGSNTYRAIYGDLSIRNGDAEKPAEE